MLFYLSHGLSVTLFSSCHSALSNSCMLGAAVDASDVLLWLAVFVQAGRSSKRQLFLLPGGIERHLKIKTCSVSGTHNKPPPHIHTQSVTSSEKHCLASSLITLWQEGAGVGLAVAFMHNKDQMLHPWVSTMTTSFIPGCVGCHRGALLRDGAAEGGGLGWICRLFGYT